MLKGYSAGLMKVLIMSPLPDDLPVNAGQTNFSNAVLNPEMAAPSGLVGPDGLPSSKRFSVYRNNVMVSLIDAMAANFPAIKRLVGDDFFAATAREFIMQHPPTEPVLFLYGDGFAGFLEIFPPVADFPYLADVARVEYAWLQSYHAADMEPLEAAALGAVEAEKVGQAKFTPHSAMWLFRSIWPAATLMDRNREGADCSDIDLSIGEDILITRPQLDVQTLILPEGGYEFISALAAGETLEGAAGIVMGTVADFDLPAQISGMLECGAFCQIELS